MTTLYSFTGASDGFNPWGGLLEDPTGVFYGITAGEIDPKGPGSTGTVFRINADGSETTVYRFTAGSDGETPIAPLILGTDGNLYGTASVGGGTGFRGTIFKLTPAGSITILHRFDGTDGVQPSAPLYLASDGNFYSTAIFGGANSAGTIFEVGADGTFHLLYSFTGGQDGESPESPVVEDSSGNFYGTTLHGGANGDGVVFKFTPPNTFVTLHSFTGFDGSVPSDGGLVWGPSGVLYGSTDWGGPQFNGDAESGTGTIFKITTSGSFMSLHSFSGNDGLNPDGVLFGTDGNIYGTTGNGGANEAGTVFEMTPSGALTTLVTFAGANGASPISTITEGSDGNIYGTTHQGGTDNEGTAFRLSLGLPLPANHFSITAPFSAGMGQPFNFQITALDQSNNTVANYNGIVHFTSSDPSSTLPADTTLTNGAGSFNATLNTLGGQTITATDSHIASISGMSGVIEVAPPVMHVFNAGLQMISAPADFSGLSLSQIFSPSSVTLAVWQQLGDQYVLSPNPPADTIVPGGGYWVRFTSSSTLFDLGQHTSLNASVQIPLSIGWNMIGDPFSSAVPLSSILVSSGNSTVSFTTASQTGIVGASLYTYPAGATSYQLEQNGLQPFAGYWVFADKPCTLIIPGS